MTALKHEAEYRSDMPSSRLQSCSAVHMCVIRALRQMLRVTQEFVVCLRVTVLLWTAVGHHCPSLPLISPVHALEFVLSPTCERSLTSLKHTFILVSEEFSYCILTVMIELRGASTFACWVSMVTSYFSSAVQ